MKFFLITMFLGVVFLIISVTILFIEWKEVRDCTVSAVGTVVELKEQKSRSYTSRGYHRTTTTWHPVIEYYADGQTIRKVSSRGQNPPKYQVGQRVEIKYNPNNLEKYIIANDPFSVIMGGVFMGVSIVLFGVALFIFKEMKT